MSVKKMCFEKCSNCGQFIGFDNYVVSTPYGTYGDIDEPDPEFLCLKCWDGWDEKSRILVCRTSYIGPIVVRDKVETQYIPIDNVNRNVV